jgi:class 3 adenylate cyclase
MCVGRKLAAILVADVVGYSKLMAEDESGTLARLKEHRSKVFDPNISQHNGRIIKLMGDGTLVEFVSVVDAVECALAIQSALANGVGFIQLRIAVNLGDVIIDGDDIYGDGVNIAARLEALAEPGGICISSIVHDRWRRSAVRRHVVPGIIPRRDGRRRWCGAVAVAAAVQIKAPGHADSIADLDSHCDCV